MDERGWVLGTIFELGSSKTRPEMGLDLRSLSQFPIEMGLSLSKIGRFSETRIDRSVGDNRSGLPPESPETGLDKKDVAGLTALHRVYARSGEILAKVTRALNGDNSSAAVQKIRQVTLGASAPLDYGVVNARVTAALLALRMEKQAPVPADRKADVELVRK